MDFFEMIQGFLSLGFVTTCIVVIMMVRKGLKPFAILFAVITALIALVVVARRARKPRTSTHRVPASPVYTITKVR